MEDRPTYVLVDGENIDMTLGGILDRKPLPQERPRWQQVLTFAEREWGKAARGLFFVNATRGFHGPFAQALQAMGYRPVLLAGEADEKVVDIGIQRTLHALGGRDADVVLATHDGDFVDDLASLVGPSRRVAVIGFVELMSQSLRQIDGLEVFDLESDAAAFDQELPRLRVIPLAEFDPHAFL